MLPKYRRPTHPGKILKEEFLDPMNLTQTNLAKHLKWTHAKVNEIINGKRGITIETALSLADTFSTSVEFWLNLQQNYDLWQAQQEHDSVPKLKMG